MKRLIYFGVLAFGLWTGAGMAQNGPLRIEITDGVIEPLTLRFRCLKRKILRR